MERLAPHHKFPRAACRERESFLLDLCSGRRVLHLACAAWPATVRWCEDGSLLHLRLSTVSKMLAGFDLSGEGLAVLERRGLRHLFRVDLLDADAMTEAWEQLDFEPELVILGEVLEHLEAPGVILRNCARHMSVESSLIVTVPNAFAMRGIFHALRGYEKVAADHVAYYSPTNLGELLARCGFVVEEMLWYRHSRPRSGGERVLDWFLNPILKGWPQLSEGIVARCRKAEDALTRAR